MTSERLFTPPLVAFLVIVGAVLAVALAARIGQASVDSVVMRLSVGDLDGQERRQLLQQLLQAEQDPQEGVRHYRIMAAVALEDRAALRRLLLSGGSPGWARQVAALDENRVARISLGDPVLAALLAAMLAEARGQADAAQRYRQVQASSILFHMELAHELAGAGLARLR